MNLGELKLAERIKKFAGYETDPVDESALLREAEEEKRIQAENEVAQGEARDLRIALAGAARHILPYLKRDLDDVRQRMATAAISGSQYEVVYWSGHLERLLGIIRNMEEA